MEILGYRIMSGDGLRFTMDVGIIATDMVGDGFLDMNGDQLGFPGDRVAVNMAGLRWVLA